MPAFAARPATAATVNTERWRQLAWFVGLWAAGVAVFALLGAVFRWVF